MENRAKYSFESRFTTKKNLMSFAFLAESLDRRELCDIAACAVSPRFADEALCGFGANVRLLSTRSSLTLRIRRLACVASAITLSAHTDAKTRKQPVRAEESTTRVYSSTLMDGTDVWRDQVHIFILRRFWTFSALSDPSAQSCAEQPRRKDARYLRSN
jgi:hypothetical protein